MTKRAASRKHRNTTNFGSVLRSWRMLRDLPLRSAAKELGIGTATLMRIEMGHTPDFATMLKILNWFKTPASKETRD